MRKLILQAAGDFVPNCLSRLVIAKSCRRGEGAGLFSEMHRLGDLFVGRRYNKNQCDFVEGVPDVIEWALVEIKEARDGEIW